MAALRKSLVAATLASLNTGLWKFMW